VLVVVNLEPGVPRRGRLALDARGLGLEAATTLAAHDLLADEAVARWPIDAITIDCTPDQPARVFRITPWPAAGNDAA